MLKRIHKALSCTSSASVAVQQPTPEQIRAGQERFEALQAMSFHQPLPRVTDVNDNGRVGFAVMGYMR